MRCIDDSFDKALKKHLYLKFKSMLELMYAHRIFIKNPNLL